MVRNHGLPDGPLRGIRVVELGTAIAGPMCGMLLGDMGADVLKIEIPGKGDDSRNWGEKVKGETPYFIQYNRNKKSMTLDIKRQKGMGVLLKLIEGCDVLVENFRPGVMKKLSLSYEELSAHNPGLVYCSISGFGQTGPYSQLGGYDTIIQAMSGLMSVNGRGGEPPLRMGVPLTDMIAAVYAAFSVALALFSREGTGRGQAIDVSLLDAGVQAVGQWLTISSLTGKSMRRFGNRYPLLAPYEPFETKDLPIVVAVGNEELWRKFCEVLEREELVNDPRFGTNRDRIVPENRDALVKELQETLSTRTAEQWIDVLWKAGIPSGPINKVEDLPADPHLNSRGVFAVVRHGALGEIRIAAPLPRLSHTPGSVRLAPPTLGQHTDEVLREMGLSNKEIDSLKSEKVV